MLHDISVLRLSDNITTFFCMRPNLESLFLPCLKDKGLRTNTESGNALENICFAGRVICPAYRAFSGDYWMMDSQNFADLHRFIIY